MLTFEVMRRDKVKEVAAAMVKDGLVRGAEQTPITNRVINAIESDSQLRALIDFAKDVSRTAQDPCPDCTPDRVCFAHKAIDLVA